MCVKAIKIEDAQELCFRLLALIIKEDDERRSRRVSYSRLAEQLDVSEEVVRYNIRKLVKLDYLRYSGNGYEPTEKVLFLNV